MTDSSPGIIATTCLGRTCLKWGEDGELAAQDLSLVMERLAQVDGDVAALYDNHPDRQPTPSLS